MLALGCISRGSGAVRPEFSGVFGGFDIHFLSVQHLPVQIVHFFEVGTKRKPDPQGAGCYSGGGKI